MALPGGDAACHVCYGGPARQMAVHPQERGGTWHHPTAAFLVLDCSSDLRACGGGRSHGMLQPCPKKSVHVNILLSAPRGCHAKAPCLGHQFTECSSLPFPSLWWPQGLLEVSECQPDTAGAFFLLLLSPGPTHPPRRASRAVGGQGWRLTPSFTVVLD